MQAAQQTQILAQIANCKITNPDNLMAKHFDLKYFNNLSKELKPRLLQICKSGVRSIVV